MTGEASARDPVEQLAQAFLERYRRGERPAITEYTQKHPELADDIRDLFPALVVMEEAGPRESQPTGSRPVADGRVPERMGDYRIVREVGRGGMGIVYEAVQEALGRHVALKVLPFQAGADPVRLLRFRREARSLARLHHTNIVPVFDVGEHQGTHYYAMQFIQGQGLDEVLVELQRFEGPAAPPQLAVANLPQSLADSLMRGQFGDGFGPEAAPAVTRTGDDAAAVDPASEAPLRPGVSTQSAPGTHWELSTETGVHYHRSVARVGLQVAEALAYAHGQRVLHRDIKPSNLLLDVQGTVWVTDFGLAKEEGEDLTQTGDLVGTLRYMAPERFRGVSDARSDLYSLGLTLYELLTLGPAFQESDRGLLIKQIYHDEPPRPRRFDRQVPRDLETIVLKAIAKEPARRYQTAEDLAEDLRRFLGDRPIRARRSAAWEHAWRWCRRNPVVAGLSAAVALLLLVVGVGLPVGALLRGERDRALAAEGEARTLALRAQNAEGQARDAERENKIREHLARAAANRRSRQPGQRFESLADIAKAMKLRPSPELRRELRNEAIAALALPDVHITQEFNGFPPGTVAVELSDDFELYARTTDTGACLVCRVADDAVVARLPELGEPAHAIFATGRILGLRGSKSGRFQLWDLSGPKPASPFPEKQGITQWRFHPNGRLVALAHADDRGGPDFVDVYDVATGARLHSLQVKGLRVDTLADLSFNPTAPFLAVTSYFSNVVSVYDLRTGAAVASAPGPGPMGNGAADWSPDGRTLTQPSGDTGPIQEYAFDPQAPALRPTRTIQGPEAGGSWITYNPQGDRYVRRGWSGVVHLFDAVSGQPLFSTHSLPEASHTWLRFDHTGQRLAAARVGDRQDVVGLWSIADGREYRALIPRQKGIDTADHTLGVHPNGRLAVVSSPGGLVFFDLETGAQVAFVPMPKGPHPHGAAIAIDGAGALFSNHFSGCLRWPIRAAPTKSDRWQVGPPERLPFQPGNSTIATSRDGRVRAQCMWAGYGMAPFAGGWILHPNFAMPRRVQAGAGTGCCSVSPDGRWVAFAGPHGPIYVYEAATTRRVWESPGGQGTHFLFSPDGRWLVTNVDGGRLYAVATWESGPRLGPGTPWDVTSELAVLGLTNGVYRLVGLATGRELARLEDPEQNTGQAAFTPHGAKLVVVARNGLRVWDLRRIRAELANLDLDWESSPIPPSVPDGTPLQVNVDSADVGMTAAEKRSYWQRDVAFNSIRLALNPFDAQAALRRGTAYLHLGEHARAVDDYAQALALISPGREESVGGVPASELAGYLNHSAWLCARKPARSNDCSKALVLARKAVELAPRAWMNWNTLGVLHYRLGNYQEARKHLERSLHEGQDETAAFDLFFLAMCHQRLGQGLRARDCYTRAVRWIEAKQGILPARWVEELKDFRTEAAGTLGLAKP
jgi:serine/threonine protein kinase/WD40 repeat protein